MTAGKILMHTILLKNKTFKIFSKFYKCYMGRAYVVKCPKGQNWALSLNRCEHASIAKCKVLKPSIKPAQLFESEFVEELDDEDDYMQNEEFTYHDATNIIMDTDYKIKDQRCTDDPNDRFHPVQFLHPSDCGMFYKCIEGIGYKLRCPSSLFYNTLTQECDYPENVNCNTASHSKAYIVQANFREVSIPQCGVSGTGRFSVENSFTSYFECENGIPYLRQCKDHELFNPIVRNCEYVTISDSSLMQQLELLRFHGEQYQSLQQNQPNVLNYNYKGDEFSHKVANLDSPNEVIPELIELSIFDKQTSQSRSDFQAENDKDGEDNLQTFRFESGTMNDSCPETDDASSPVHLSHESDW